MKIAVLVCVVGLTALAAAAPSDRTKRQTYSAVSVTTPNSPPSAPSSGRRSFGSRLPAGVPTQNPFLAGIGGSSSSNDGNTYYLKSREAIRLMSGFLPILTGHLTQESNKTAAEKMRDITVAFLPLTRDVVESRKANNGDLEKQEAAEEFVPALLNAIVDYVDSFDVPNPASRDDLLPDFPQFDLEDPTAFLDNVPRIVIRD